MQNNKESTVTGLIFFKEGSYNIGGKPQSVTNMIFPLVEDIREDEHGLYVTVDARGVKRFPDRNIRIRINSKDSFIPHTGSVEQHLAEANKNESDNEIKERLRKRFSVLTDMTNAAKRGDVRAIIVSGPPGVGKSYGVEAELQKTDLFTRIANKKPKYEVIKGAMSALGLYIKLHEFKDAGNVVVFDDCDSILFDDLSLNILKAALDTSKRRHISWNTDSRVLREENIPNRFEFCASAMFISNIKFDNVKSKKLKDHLEALESRCHYVDLTINTEREKSLRIRQIVEDGMLRDYGFDPSEVESILNFIDTNKKRLRELSLRTVLKLADLKKSFGDRFEDYATVTLLK
jgi:hypothetical protein